MPLAALLLGSAAMQWGPVAIQTGVRAAAGLWDCAVYVVHDTWHACAGGAKGKGKGASAKRKAEGAPAAAKKGRAKKA